VLEETVRRQHKMWSWQRMKAHRQLCMQYKDLYKTKLLSTKHSADLLTDVEVQYVGLCGKPKIGLDSVLKTIQIKSHKNNFTCIQCADKERFKTVPK